MGPNKHLQTIILELAAIVFLFITAPVWLPIALFLGAGALALGAIGLVATILLATCAKADVIVAVDQLHLHSAMFTAVNSWPL